MLKKELEKELNRTKLILDYAREEIKQLKFILRIVREKLLCYGETFDSKIHQEMQKELLEILDKVGSDSNE